MFGGMMNNLMNNMNDMMNMSKMGLSDSELEQMERLKEIEAKIQRGEAKEEDYPEYMKAKQFHNSKKENEEQPVFPKPDSTHTSTHETNSHIPTIRNKWKEGGAEAAFYYIESIIYSMTFQAYCETITFFR